MKYYIVVTMILFGFLIQGCSQKETPQVMKEVKKQEDNRITFVEIKNIDELNLKVNIFLNKYYAEDIKKVLIQGSDYELEYLNVSSKTYIFVKFKNNFIFCGNIGCTAKMLEYKENDFIEMESFTLSNSSIYLIHDYSTYGFSQMVIPVGFLDGSEWSLYYAVYEPFTQNDYRSVYPKDRGYKELKALINSRKTSIELFWEEE